MKYSILIFVTIFTHSVFAQIQNPIKYESNRLIIINDLDSSNKKIVDGYRVIETNFETHKIIVYGSNKEFDLDIVSKIEEKKMEGTEGYMAFMINCLDQEKNGYIISLIFKNNYPQMMHIRSTTKTSYIYYINPTKDK